MVSVGMTFKPNLMKIYPMAENIIGDGVKHNETNNDCVKFENCLKKCS
jgi:hypothetical protein